MAKKIVKKEMTAAEIEHSIFVRAQDNVEGTKLIEEYAKRKMIDFVERISKNPISCYSQKFSGQEKQFFLGNDYVQSLIKSISKS
jgi:hypothetical protein